MAAKYYIMRIPLSGQKKWGRNFNLLNLLFPKGFFPWLYDSVAKVADSAAVSADGAVYTNPKVR